MLNFYAEGLTRINMLNFLAESLAWINMLNFLAEGLHGKDADFFQKARH